MQVADLTGRLDRADTELADRKEQLTAKDQQLKAKDQQLMARDRHLDRQAAQIDFLLDTTRQNGGAA